MSMILQLDSGLRAVNSLNPDRDPILKSIALRFIDTWKQNRPKDEYIYRDTEVNPPDFNTHDRIGTVFPPAYHH